MDMLLRAQYWIPSIIFLISFCLHLSLISKGPVTIDCLGLAINSQATLETLHLHYQSGSGYPLMVLLGSIFIAIGKYIGITDQVIAINFISVVVSSIAILAFYLLIQEICDSLTAIFASFILLLNPIFLDVSTYGINHAPALCFLLLGLLSLLHFKTAGNIINLLLSALYFGFMGATRLQDLILTFPAIGFMFILGLKPYPLQNNKYNVRHFLLFITTIILLIIFFHLPYLIFNHTIYEIQAKNYWESDLTGSFQELLSQHFILRFYFLIKAFSIVSIIYFGAALYYAAILNKRFLIFTLLWWIIPLCFFANIKITVNAPRLFSIILPALIIPISIYLAHMIRNKRMLWKIIALISFLIIVFEPLLNTQETFIRRHHYASIPDYYHWVKKSTEPNATIITSDDGLFITYYSRRKILSKPVSTEHLSPKELNDFKKELDNILNNRKPVYITTWTLVAYDHYLEFNNLLTQNYHLIQKGQMPLETWFRTPYSHAPLMCGLVKIEK